MLTSKPVMKIGTGVAGLDAVLGGGLPRGGTYLVQGEAGTGKTTLALQFLLSGLAEGESALYITLSQTTEWLHKIATSHGWALDGVDLLNATAIQSANGSGEQVLLHSADFELNELTKIIIDAVDRLRPRRLVLDALSYLRLLAGSALRYRHEMLALQKRFSASEATVMVLDDLVTDQSQTGIHNLVDGVIQIDQRLIGHSTLRRHLQVLKLRAQPFVMGLHDMQIHTGGVHIFPQMRVSDVSYAQMPTKNEWPQVKTGIAELDQLLGGGLESGTSCLLIGAAGTGKTTLVTLYSYALTNQERRVAVFLFDESIDTFLNRSTALNMDLHAAVASGRLLLQQVNAGEVSPAEFAHLLRTTVEEQGVDLVAVDSLTGYVSAVAQERQILVQMHELITYLNRLGVLSIITVAQHGLLGHEIDSKLDISYLSDAVIVLRHFEGVGHVRQSISVFKKRHSSHEKAIRELLINADGVKIGETLDRFRQILSGWPSIQNPWNVRFDQDNNDSYHAD